MYRRMGGQDSVGHKPFFTLNSEILREGPPSMACNRHLNVALPAAARTEQRQNFWSIRSALRWNTLNDEVKMASNVNSFKNVYNAEVLNRRHRY